MTTPTYERDFYAWTRQQAQALRAKDWAALDVAMRSRATWSACCCTS